MRYNLAFDKTKLWHPDVRRQRLSAVIQHILLWIQSKIEVFTYLGVARRNNFLGQEAMSRMGIQEGQNKPKQCWIISAEDNGKKLLPV